MDISSVIVDYLANCSFRVLTIFIELFLIVQVFAVNIVACGSVLSVEAQILVQEGEIIFCLLAYLRLGKAMN